MKRGVIFRVVFWQQVSRTGLQRVKIAKLEAVPEPKRTSSGPTVSAYTSRLSAQLSAP